MPVHVVRSHKRKRTAQAQLREGRLRVMIPAGLDAEEESRLVDLLTDRARRKLSSATVDLEARAASLADRFTLTAPARIIWSDRQVTRWGSCTPAEGTIRISNRLSAMPGWVLDSVIIHELAHLEVPNHGPRFQALIDRYPLAERAKGYLIAKAEQHPEIAVGPDEPACETV